MKKATKKWLAALLAALMLFSLTACGESEQQATEPAETQETEQATEPAETQETEQATEPAETQETEQATEPAETQETEQATEPAETQETEQATEPAEAQEVEQEAEPAEAQEAEPAEASAAASPKTIETSLWSLTYDEADGWTYDEDSLSDWEGYSELFLKMPTEDGEDYTISLWINASVENEYYFREYLTSYGFDQYEYAVNGAYDLFSVGGVDCLKYEGETWGSPCLCYFGRVESAETTVQVEIDGDYEDARVEKLLSGLTFRLTDTGNEDAPWSWEGEPFSAEEHDAAVGSYTLHSQWLPITDCIITSETFEHYAAAVGQDIWLTVDGQLRRYSYDGTSLTLAEEIESDEYLSCITADETGTLWMGDPLVCFISWKDGAQTASYNDLQKVAMHPSGTWGVNYWFDGSECEKLTFSEGSVVAQPLPLSEVGSISRITVDENHIYVCGEAVDETGHRIFVYDHDGNLQMTLTDPDGEALGSITYVAETANGFFALDGNMREILLWTKDGSCIGLTDDGELFGTSYPWFCDATMLDDGSILVIMTEERADRSAIELVAFRVSGF